MYFHIDTQVKKNCLNVLAKSLNCYSVEGRYNTVALPYGIGCGLAGGDWYIIKGMLEDFSIKVKQKVVIVSLK